MKDKIKKDDLHLAVVVDRLYVTCAKCKKLEDEFFAGEIPNEFGWYYHRKKWYCKSCYNDL
jgi:hypothetical protein